MLEPTGIAERNIAQIARNQGVSFARLNGKYPNPKQSHADKGLMFRIRSQTMDEVRDITIDRDAPVNIRDVKVNTALPKRECILDFIRQIENSLLLWLSAGCGTLMRPEFLCPTIGNSVCVHRSSFVVNAISCSRTGLVIFYGLKT